MYDPSRTSGASPYPLPAAMRGRTPSGLFPSASSRPIYRETLAAQGSAVLAGAGASAVWMLLCGLIAGSARSYCWWSIGGGMVAWAAALILVRTGDRGVAAGVAMGAGAGVAIAMGVVLVRWIGGHWLLW
jgi:hypothetical protein